MTSKFIIRCVLDVYVTKNGNAFPNKLGNLSVLGIRWVYSISRPTYINSKLTACKVRQATYYKQVSDICEGHNVTGKMFLKDIYYT